MFFFIRPREPRDERYAWRGGGAGGQGMCPVCFEERREEVEEKRRRLSEKRRKEKERRTRRAKNPNARNYPTYHLVYVHSNTHVCTRTHVMHVPHAHT